MAANLDMVQFSLKGKKKKKKLWTCRFQFKTSKTPCSQKQERVTVIRTKEKERVTVIRPKETIKAKFYHINRTDKMTVSHGTSLSTHICVQSQEPHPTTVLLCRWCDRQNSLAKNKRKRKTLEVQLQSLMLHGIIARIAHSFCQVCTTEEHNNIYFWHCSWKEPNSYISSVTWERHSP